VTRTLILPRLVAGRDFADDMADKLGSVKDDTVLIDGSGLLTGTGSFAAQLVSRLLGGGAAQLVVSDAPDEFAEYLRKAAEALGASERLTLRRRTSVVTA
jgi:3-oxoacyl-ACP reductase-like protein